MTLMFSTRRKRLLLLVSTIMTVPSSAFVVSPSTTFARSAITLSPINKPLYSSDSSWMPDECNDCITQSVRSWDDNKNDDNNFKEDTRIIQNTILLLAVVLSVVTPLVTSVEWDAMRGWSPSEVVQGLLQGNWDRYISVLTNYPIPTKAVTSATVYTIGDILAQRTEGKTIGDLDRLRVLRSLTAGLIGHGPLSHCWYNFSEGLFTDSLQWTAWWAFIPKVVLDQMLWGPIWNNTYIALLGLMKRDSIHTIWGDIRRTTVPLVLSGLKLWPLAHCVTYGLIPVENRLLWVDTVEILWVTILATQAAAGAVTAEDAVIVMPIEPNNDAATFVEKS